MRAHVFQSLTKRYILKIKRNSLGGGVPGGNAVCRTGIHGNIHAAFRRSHGRGIMRPGLAAQIVHGFLHRRSIQLHTGQTDHAQFLVHIHHRVIQGTGK